MRQKETARCPHCSMPVYLTEYDTIHYNYCGCNSEGHDDVATDECCEITYDAFICDGVIKYYYHDDDYVVVPLSGFFCAFDPGYIKQKRPHKEDKILMYDNLSAEPSKSKIVKHSNKPSSDNKKYKHWGAFK